MARTGTARDPKASDRVRSSGPLGDAKEATMLWTITVLLFLMWLVGMVSNYTLGGFIHLLLLLAIVTILIRVIQGRRPV
jgi:hypothetical protein